MTDEDLKQRQEDELEAIKAIYLSDVIDITFSRKGNPQLILRLFPQRGSSGGARVEFEPMFVVLSINMPANYPNVIPEITVKESKGLSSQEVTELKTGMDKLVKANLGEVMILTLAQFAEEYLHGHRKIPVGSFYDEMLLRKKQQQEESIQKKQEDQEKKRLAVLEEIQKRQDAWEEELRKQKEWKVNSEILGKSPTSQSYYPSSSPFKGDEFPQTGPVGFNPQKKRRSISARRRRSTSEGSDSSFSGSSDIISMEFSCGKVLRKFQRGEALGESDKGSRVYVGMDCTNGSLVAISEWCFEFSNGKKNHKKGNDVLQNLSSQDTLLKQFHGFEPEFNSLQKLDHPNIIHYLGMRIVNDDPSSVYLYIAQEFIRGTTLQPYLQGSISVDVSMVRKCASGVLEALNYLHANDVVHRFLRDTCVFVDNSGEVKVGDYGLERKICELYETHAGKSPAVERFSPSIGRGAKRTDIYRFGILILSLLKGEYESRSPPRIPATLPEELKDFLEKCLTTNEAVRWTASQLLGHEFLKTSCQKGLVWRFIKDEDHDENVDGVDVNQQDTGIPMYNFPVSKGASRFYNEFEYIQGIGKGGFGEVMKVKNKLDGGIYALKKIILDPRNKQLNKKITREVKLLSQLHHENVVRYFNSWIETVIDSGSEENSSTMFTPSTPANSGTVSTRPESRSVRFNLDNGYENSIGILDNIEALAPPMKDTEWSISVPDGSVGYDTDESSEEEDIFGTSFLRLGNENSEEVVFEPEMSSEINFGSESSENQNTVPVTPAKRGEEPIEPGPGILTEIQCMYIQMEFCEKSTLRTAIDDGLFQDMDRGWRLFREIVEGLVHIHQQGMIHRDLKPVNIFLDSNDHVKIGDFGLATNNILPKNQADLTLFDTGKPGVQQSMDFGEESMTGHVGTALYVAPELITAAGTKVLYNQKVDIYSLGIILFEMFYRPIETGMERYNTIVTLRQKQVIFPADFDEQLLPQVVNIVRWLLSHDPSQRPTSLELLQSEHMPPPLMEETALDDMLRRTLSKSTSKAYKHLIAECFRQKPDAADDITYNYGLEKFVPNPTDEIFRHALMQKLKKIAQATFERHGAIEINTPLLTPKTELYQPHKHTVFLMSHFGNIVSIPYDLRVTFAKHVVWNKITNIKRFSISKVFREKKVYGHHPSELYECALDIISSSKGTLISDAEVLAISFEVFGEVPWLRDKGFTIRLSHTNLLDAVLLHHGIDGKHGADIKAILKPDGYSRSQVHTHLVSLCLPDQFMSMLFSLLDMEGSLEKISEYSIFKGILKKKGLAASKVKEAFHELEILIGNLEYFGLKCEIVVTPALLFGTTIYTGLLWQVVCNLRRHKNRQTVDVIAVGGRYDALMEQFRSTLEMYGMASKDVTQYGVGISISLDQFVNGLNCKDWDKTGAVKTVDVLICSLGHHPMSKEKINLMKDLLAHGVQCSLMDESESIESVEEYCRQLGAQFIVILKETEDIRIRTWEKDRFQEKRLAKAELIEHIERNKKAGHDESFGFSSLSRVDSVNFRNAGQSSESGGNISTLPLSSSNMPSVNVSFIHQDRDKTAQMKRRQHQILSHVESALCKFSKQQLVQLIVTDVSSAVVNSLATIQLHDKIEFHRSVQEVTEKHPRLKRHIQSICDEIFDLTFEKAKVATVIILYAFNDTYFRVLI